jgi:hypothetical protein
MTELRPLAGGSHLPPIVEPYRPTSGADVEGRALS